jgi:RHS repeat-associated protein
VSVGLPNGDLVEYLVDGKGRRVGKKHNGVLLKQWIYRNLLKPVAELDGAGNLVAEFVYGSKANVPDYVLRGGTVYRIVSDQLGTPRRAVNAANSGDVPFSANYTSFGEASGTGLDWMPFGFAGGMHDMTTGLVRFGVRDYDPRFGRWTSSDPIRFTSRQANLYVYVGNDPINRIDIYGLASPWDVFECIFNIVTCSMTCANPVTRPECGICGADVARDCGEIFPDPPPSPPRPPQLPFCEDPFWLFHDDEEYRDLFGCEPQRTCDPLPASPCDPSIASCQE